MGICVFSPVDSIGVPVLYIGALPPPIPTLPQGLVRPKWYLTEVAALEKRKEIILLILQKHLATLPHLDAAAAALAAEADAVVVATQREKRGNVSTGIDKARGMSRSAAGRSMQRRRRGGNDRTRGRRGGGNGGNTARTTETSPHIALDPGHVRRPRRALTSRPLV